VSVPKESGMGGREGGRKREIESQLATACT